MIWDHDRYMGMDFETSGEKPEYALQPWRIKQRKAWATSLVWATRVPGGVFDRIGGGLNPTRVQMVLMLETAIKENRRIVGWNVVYDIAILLGYGLHDLVFQCRWLDGMLLWRHVEVEPEYGIKGPSKKSFALKGKYADVEDEEADGTVTTSSQLASKGCVEVLWPDEAGYQEDIDFHDPDPLKRQRLHEYNIGDVKFTLRGAQHWWEALTPKQQGAALIEAESLPWIAAANLEGLPLDRIECSNLQANLALRAIDRMDRLGTFGFTKEIGASPAKLANLLFDVWRLPVYKRNKLTVKQQEAGIKEGTRSTDKEVLHELGLNDKRVGIFQEYRSCVNNGKKFATAPLISADYNAEGNVTHPQGRVFSTYTGRLTYSSKQGRGVKAVQTGFALHQMNKKPEFRRIVIAPPGYDMIEFDAAGQEFRWMAVASRDQTMLHLCGPGQDPHSFLGSAIYKLDYMDLIARYKAAEEEAERQRKMGKVGNLCNIRDTPILTDRGYVYIQDVRHDDLVWDGVEFVSHDGVTFSGVLPVMTYQGITATPDHKVLVDGAWVEIQEASRHGWRVEPALGSGWSSVCWSALRIMDGIISRTISEVRGALRAGALRLWDRARGEPAVYGDQAFAALRLMRDEAEACECWPRRYTDRCRREVAPSSAELVSAVQQSERRVLPQLWRAWDRMSVFLGSGSDGVCQSDSTARDLSRGGYRPRRQRWPLRAGEPPVNIKTRKLAKQEREQPCLVERQGHPDDLLGFKSIFTDLHHALCGAGAFWRRYPAPSVEGCRREAQVLEANRSEAPCYDIVNCGPRSRFCANGRIVHNSLQYRTSPPRLRITARVDYDIPMELPEAEHIHQTYQLTYPEVPRYWGRQISIVKACGYVETFAGRRVQIKGDWNGPNKWAMGSTAINYRIQGTGGDQKYLAIAVIQPILKKYEARFAFDLHDGLYFYVKSELLRAFAEEMKHTLDNLPYQRAWGMTPPIPMTWDAKAGPSWGNLKGVKF